MRSKRSGRDTVLLHTYYASSCLVPTSAHRRYRRVGLTVVATGESSVIVSFRIKHIVRPEEKKITAALFIARYLLLCNLVTLLQRQKDQTHKYCLFWH